MGCRVGCQSQKKITFYQFFPWPLIGLNSANGSANNDHLFDVEKRRFPINLFLMTRIIWLKQNSNKKSKFKSDLTKNLSFFNQSQNILLHGRDVMWLLEKEAIFWSGTYLTRFLNLVGFLHILGTHKGSVVQNYL